MNAAFASVSAPGKVFLVGEYAVLDGGTAVVAAVDRRARGRFVPGSAPSTPLVAEAIRAVGEYLAPSGPAVPAGAPEIDSSALSAEGGKLGLGSSAAAAVVAVGALLEAAGREAGGDRALAFRLADRAHRAVQGGRGSGGDVAAAVFGGVIAYRRAADGAPVVRTLGSAPGELVVFSAGAPRSTVTSIRDVEALAARDRDRYEDRLREISAATADFLLAWDALDGGAVVAAVDRAGRALGALGESAEMEIWTDATRAAAKLARELGGAAKPSGAGGGDVGTAFFADAEAAQAFRRRAPRIGVEALDILIGARGLTRGD
jgi:phosphomevalonate kinase